MKYFFVVLFLSVISNSFAQTISDVRDGKNYKVVTIGTQTWMAENLAFKVEGAVAYGDDESNVTKYGYLYDWETSKNVCPSGFKLPNESDWNTLVTALGGKNAAGGKLKGTTEWKAPNRFASNSSAFNALPSGAFIEGEYLGLGISSYFWSSEAECTSSYTKFLTFKAGFADTKSIAKTDNAAVRCVKK